MDGPVWQLNLRHLRALAAIDALGSISAAARQVGLSQPAITQGIAKIEKTLGISLFDRHSEGMAPTPAGRALATRGAAALAQLASAFTAREARLASSFSHIENLVTMTQIRALIAIAASGSFVSAAARTRLSQPSIHRAVRDLERLCGVTLVERRGRGVAMTAPGRRIARGFRLAIAEIEAGLSEITAEAGRETGWIAIGALPLSRARLIPHVVARFHAEHPEVDFAIHDGSYADLIEALRDGTLDMVVGALRDPPPGKDVEQRALFEDRLVIACRAGHPLTARPHATLSDMAECDWIVAGEGTPTRGQWEQLFARARLSLPRAPIACGSVNAIRMLLAETDCLTILSPDQIAQDIADGRLAILAGPIDRTARPIGVTTRAGWRPTRLQSDFIAALATAASESRSSAN